MNPTQDRHQQLIELDRLIDAALDQYTAAGPWPGVEERILSAAQAEPSRSRLRWPLAAAAALLAGTVLTYGWFSGRSHPENPGPEAHLLAPAAPLASESALPASVGEAPRPAPTRSRPSRTSAHAHAAAEPAPSLTPIVFAPISFKALP